MPERNQRHGEHEERGDPGAAGGVPGQGRGQREYRVLLGEQEIGRVRRNTKGDDQGKWFAVGTDGKRLKGEPTRRNKAGQTLVKS